MEALSLTNVDIPFTFNGKEYKIKKANLQQVIQFQRKAKEITDEKDAGGDLRMVAYSIYISLNAIDKNITEDQILTECPGDLDIMSVLSQLGFMNQQKVEAMQKLRNALGT
jgi:hypothetical protein